MAEQQRPQRPRKAAKRAAKKAQPPAAAGFRLPDSHNTIIRLRFDDPRFAGLVVSVRLSFGLIDAGGDLVTVDADQLAAGKARPEDTAKLRQLVKDFAAALQSWNLLGDDGEPVPTDHDTVRSLDYRFVLLVVNAFMGALQDLAEQAADEVREATEQQVDESTLPMEALTAA